MTRFYKYNKKLVDERYKKVQRLMNMSVEEAKEWKKHPCSKTASIKRIEVINRAIRIRRKNKEDWTSTDYRDAGKIISYISRALGIEGGKSVSKDCPETTNYYALKNWLRDIKKKRRSKMATAKKKTAKRKTAKRKTAKKKTTKRKVAKRKTAKRNPKRKSTKKKVAKRKTAKRKTTKRKTAKRKTTKRKTTRRR